MSRGDIQKWQAKRISEALFPATNYLIRLRRRMEQRGFPPDEPLYREVCAAYDAIHRLGMSMHYLSVTWGGHRRTGRLRGGRERKRP